MQRKLSRDQKRVRTYALHGIVNVDCNDLNDFVERRRDNFQARYRYRMKGGENTSQYLFLDIASVSSLGKMSLAWNRVVKVIV